MKFAYSSNAFKKYSLPDTIKIVSEIGFEGIEIMADIPHLYPLHVTAALMADIKAKLKNYGIAVSNINSFTLCAVKDMHHPSWIEKDKKQIEIRIKHTIDCIKLARELNCSSISIQPGGILENNMSEEEAIKLFIDGLNKIKKYAKEYDVKVLIEPEPNLLIENSKEYENFIKNVDDSIFGLNFDIGHFFCAGENPSSLVKNLKKYIGHFHIEDIAADRVHNHLIPGLGAINLKQVLETIKNTGYSGFISVELYPYQNDPVNAGKQALLHLNQLI